MAANEISHPWSLGADAAKPLPRGRHALSREEVLASQRGRMLHAVLIAAADKGFGYVVIGDVITEAGVSRKAFYEHFKDFEDCWFQAYETATDVLFAQMTAAALEAGGADSPQAGLTAGVGAAMLLIADEPAVAHATNLDITGGGPEALRAHQQTIGRWMNLLLVTWDGKTASESSEERRLCALAAVSIFDGIVGYHLVTGRSAELPAISGKISELMIAALSQ